MYNQNIIKYWAYGWLLWAAVACSSKQDVPHDLDDTIPHAGDTIRQEVAQRVAPKLVRSPADVLKAIRINQVADSLYQQLQAAFEAKSTPQLQAFIDRWQQYSGRQPKTVATDAPTQEILNLYEASPFNFSRFERKNKWFADAKYLVIQGQLPYAVGFDKKVPWDTLQNFTPSVKLKRLGILYYHDIYRKAFKKFLANDDYQKRSFLETLLTIEPRADTDLRSHPQVYDVQFNLALDSAVIDYVLVSTYMKSALKKKNGRWVVVRDEEVAVE